MSHDHNNFFNEDFDELLGNIETDDNLDEEFNNLFNEKESLSEQNTLTSLPSPQDIQDLFSNGINWDEEPKAKINFDDGEQDISSFFAPQNRMSPLTEEETDWDELEQLLTESTQPVPQYQPQLEKALKQNLKINLYNNFDELENLLREKVESEEGKEAMFQELESLLKSPVSLPREEEEALLAEGIAISEPELEDIDLHVEDEFRDLEKLLEATNQAMGAGSGSGLGAGQRLTSRPRTSKTFEQTMRVPIKQLDNLSNLIGELVVKRNRLEQDQERLRLFLDNLLNQVQSLSDLGGRMQDLYERSLLEGALLATRNRSKGIVEIQSPSHTPAQLPSTDNNSGNNLDDLEIDRFTDFHLLSQEMIELIVRVRESASDIQFVVDETDQVTRTFRQATTQLQENMTKSRMVPFAQTADRLPRAIREISLQLNKQAKLQVEGRDVLIDKMILEHLNSPMTHLVNNAITHGIESPEQRQKTGKNPLGTITVRTFLQGNQTVITVSDDGAGIDPNLVKNKAIQKGLITFEEAKLMTPQEVYELLFHPGFSTKDKADDFSGRGVGLDVVRTSLIDVRGSVSIDSVLGKGTTFTIRLPLTLSICKALCCISNRSRIAFSVDGLEGWKEFLPSEVQFNEEGQKCIPWYDSLLPYQPLGDLLSYNRLISRASVYGGKQDEDSICIVVLRSGNTFLAVQVEQVLPEQEIVIKQIEGPVPKPPGIAGATVLGDGTIMPIGDVLELVEIATGRLRTDTISPWRKSGQPVLSEPAQKTETTVLIVDDSITVRELLSLSFTKAGYRVEQARDGQEAWEKLRAGLPCDIVFCDIEMPRLNGLELLDNLQKDPRLTGIPVALLTSRGAERHRSLAAKLGASGYFTKPYTEKDLLDAAARMVAGEVLLGNSTKVSRKGFVTGRGEAEQEKTFPDDETLVEGVSIEPYPRPSYLVLIVDDSVTVREMLSMSFSKAGYRIEQARDGQEAWDKLRAGLACDLILCDIEMPRMNGLELLSRLQEDEQFSQIPIAMITSRGAQKMQNLAADKGAKGYFVKPYIEDVLIDAARRLINGEVLLERSSGVE
ncbi:MAG: Regulator of RpoS [Chroococcopsis gigantea SAG 12.99]|jgi:chemotaxis protein histidine kinase CheA/CheY-like chemotaxis protein|nr:Regulator of RpoS [Chroococcopsis gigantea SAG 12.99]